MESSGPPMGPRQEKLGSPQAEELGKGQARGRSTLGCFWCPPCKAAAQPVMDMFPLLCPLSSPSAPGVFLCPNSISSLPASPLCNCPLSQECLCNQVTSGSHPHLTAPTSASPVRYNPSQLAGPSPQEECGEREQVRGRERPLLSPAGVGRGSLAGRSSGGAGSGGEASLMSQWVKNPLPIQETWVQSQGGEDPWRRKWQPIPLFLS